MKISAIRTSVFSKGMNLIDFILNHCSTLLKENSILAITSKIISISENRLVNKKDINKKQLIQQEGEHYLGEIAYDCHLSIHHGLLVPSAGIDESNSEQNQYILYPKKPFSSAEIIAAKIKKKLNLKNLGILITDSRTLPLRKGVVGVALAYFGFSGIKNMVGKKDLFGRELKMTTINIVDALAASAVLLMGEGDEQKPLAVINEAPVIFTPHNDSSKLSIPVTEDLYFPLYKHLIQKK